MNTQRLLQIAEDTRNAPANQFDLSGWKSIPRLNCGTAACAIGHHIDAHPEAALKWRRYDGGAVVPVFRGRDGFDAVEAYCDIGIKDAELLFDAASYSRENRKNREVVAARIEQFVRDHEQPFIAMKPEQQPVNVASK